MKKSFDVVIQNQKFTIRSDADERHVKKVTEIVNKKMQDLLSANPNMSTLQAAILTSLNVTDDFLKMKVTFKSRIEGWVERVKILMNALESR